MTGPHSTRGAANARLKTRCLRPSLHSMEVTDDRGLHVETAAKILAG